MNLGSPDSTEVKDVKRYLDEFLMDGRVIDYPYLFRLLLVRGIITPTRSILPCLKTIARNLKQFNCLARLR